MGRTFPLLKRVGLGVIAALVLSLLAPLGLTQAAPPPAAERSPLTLKSASYELMEAESGQVLLSHRPDEKRHPASVTKMMTLLVAYEALQKGQFKLSNPVTASEAAASMGGTRIFLSPGETFTLGDLLKSVAVGSANDASVAVAEHIGGSEAAFVERMNQRSKELGMNHTHWVNVTGLDAPEHLTTAHDLALLSREIVLHHPEIMELTKIYMDQLPTPNRKKGPFFELVNRNKLVRFYSGADGLKTGWTSGSGYCISATAKREGVRLIAVIMGAPDAKTRMAESTALLNYGFAQLQSVTVAPAGQEMAKVPVRRGMPTVVSVVPERPLQVAILKGQAKQVKVDTRLPARLEAPVTKGQAVGELVASLDGKELGRVRLITAQPVEKLSVWGNIGQSLKRMLHLGGS